MPSDGHTLDEEIANARKELVVLQNELALLLAHHRVARDEELGRQIEGLRERIRLGDEMETARAGLAKDLKATKRPDRADVESYQSLQDRLKKAEAKMEATGVRYELSMPSPIMGTGTILLRPMSPRNIGPEPVNPRPLSLM